MKYIVVLQHCAGLWFLQHKVLESCRPFFWGLWWGHEWWNLRESAASTRTIKVFTSKIYWDCHHIYDAWLMLVTLPFFLVPIFKMLSFAGLWVRWNWSEFFEQYHERLGKLVTQGIPLILGVPSWFWTVPAYRRERCRQRKFLFLPFIVQLFSGFLFYFVSEASYVDFWSLPGTFFLYGILSNSLSL